MHLLMHMPHNREDRATADDLRRSSPDLSIVRLGAGMWFEEGREDIKQGRPIVVNSQDGSLRSARRLETFDPISYPEHTNNGECVTEELFEAISQELKLYVTAG